jgi:hypothetical protein
MTLNPYILNIEVKIALRNQVDQITKLKVIRQESNLETSAEETWIRNSQAAYDLIKDFEDDFIKFLETAIEKRKLCPSKNNDANASSL